MVHRTVIKDYHILLASTIIEEPKEFIDNTRKQYNAMIQIVDTDAIVDSKHLEEVIRQVLEAYERGIMISKHIEMEILLRIACTNQIYKAIEFAGAKPNKLSIFIALSKDASVINKLADLDLQDINSKEHDILLKYHNIIDKSYTTDDLRAYLVEEANLIY